MGCYLRKYRDHFIFTMCKFNSFQVILRAFLLKGLNESLHIYFVPLAYSMKLDVLNCYIGTWELHSL
jgi:hypothetical protein